MDVPDPAEFKIEIGIVLGTVGLLTPVVAVLPQEAGCTSVVLSSALWLWARSGGRT